MTPHFSHHSSLCMADSVLPMDTLLNPQIRYMGEDYIPDMLQRLHMAYDEMKCNMQEARERNKKRLNAQATTHKYEAGDAVFYYDSTTTKGRSNKLTVHWKPYYRVVEQVSLVNYRICHQLTGKAKVVHAENLQPAFPEEVWDAERTLYQEVSPESEQTGRRFLSFQRTHLACPDYIGKIEQSFSLNLQNNVKLEGPTPK